MNEQPKNLADKTNPLKIFYGLTDKMPPIASTALGGALGGLGGYYGSKALTNLAISLMFANKPPEVRKQILNSVTQNSKLSRIGAIVGALGGAYFSGGRDLDFGDWGRFKNSLLDKEYWKNKNNLNTRVNTFKNKLDNKYYTTKLASEINMYTSDIIPIKQSLDLIDKDVFLDPFAKNTTADLIFGAEKKESGLTSGKDLTRSAIRAGIAFAPAYAFGSGVGSILGLPPAVRDRVSLVGGLAAAVFNSGILK